MPSCPFKVEHDNYQASFQNGGAPITNRSMAGNYWSAFGDLSCNRWRKCEPASKTEKPPKEAMPRIGTGIVAATKETFDLFLDNVDIFKYSGRLSNGAAATGPNADIRFMWRSTMMDEPFSEIAIRGGESEIAYECFSDIYEDGAAPFHMWVPNAAKPGAIITAPGRDVEKAKAMYEELRGQVVWSSKKALALDKTLRNCQNQCYDCHACERVFGYKDFDTLLEIKPVDKWAEKVDQVNIIPIKVAA